MVWFINKSELQSRILSRWTLNCALFKSALSIKQDDLTKTEINDIYFIFSIFIEETISSDITLALDIDTVHGMSEKENVRTFTHQTPWQHGRWNNIYIHGWWAWAKLFTAVQNSCLKNHVPVLRIPCKGPSEKRLAAAKSLILQVKNLDFAIDGVYHQHLPFNI